MRENNATISVHLHGQAFAETTGLALVASSQVDGTTAELLAFVRQVAAN